MNKKSLAFQILEDSSGEPKYTTTCSGSRSDCCTRVCTRVGIESSEDSIQAWEEFLEVNAGVLQY